MSGRQKIGYYARMMHFGCFILVGFVSLMQSVHLSTHSNLKISIMYLRYPRRSTTVSPQARQV